MVIVLLQNILRKMNKFIVFFIGIFFSLGVFADDCVVYKLKPKISVTEPIWQKSVVQPLEQMDLYHGNVIATLVDSYDITADITPIEDGFCVGLKNVDAIIGYSDFLVKVDIRHKPDSCTYNAVLTHEDQHIQAYLSVIEDFKSELEENVFSAANSIMPIFVSSYDEVENAINILNDKLQNHPDMVLIKQKILAAEEIRNRRVDESSTSETLKKCFDLE